MKQYQIREVNRVEKAQIKRRYLLFDIRDLFEAKVEEYHCIFMRR